MDTVYVQTCSNHMMKIWLCLKKRDTTWCESVGFGAASTWMAIPRNWAGFYRETNANHHIYNLVGGFNHLEKCESQWEGLSHILWKINNV